jgi:hypothetical protein
VQIAQAYLFQEMETVKDLANQRLGNLCLSAGELPREK